LGDCGAKVWITLDPGYMEAGRSAGVEHVIEARGLAGLLGAREPLRERAAVSPEDIALLVYTSGTTGPPKGAMILHRNIAFNVEVFRTWMQISSEDVILGMAPLFHITGLVPQLGLCYATGAPLMLFHRFDAAQILRLSRKWKPTFCVAAITAYIAL